MTDGEIKVSMDQDKNAMGYAVNWKDEIATIAGEFRPSDTKQSWLERAARRASLSLRQISALYYGQTTDPKYSVAACVLSAAEQARLEEARRDAQDLANIYRRHAETLANTDESFHRHDINALVEAARIISGRDSA